MNITPVAVYHSAVTTKFGLPRQSGLASELRGTVVLEPQFRHEEAVRGLEAFSHVWLLWEFSANDDGGGSLTVRPPRLGGNERVGVFASRSPFRPNRLGLSSVRLLGIEMSENLGPVLHVAGGDMMDGTPVYDIKPYVSLSDCHPDARCGFVDSHPEEPLLVNIPAAVTAQFTAENLAALRQLLAGDPRPRYHHDPARIYVLPFADKEVRFSVKNNTVEVIE